MNRMLPEYSTVLFTEIWDNEDDFLADYKDSGLYKDVSKITDDSAKTLFFLLYARYGNNPLANRDVNQFKYKVFSIIFQYGPAWEKELAVQKAIRELGMTDTDLQYGTGIFAGSKAIYNQALNPQTEPSTGSLNELTYINQQNTTNYKKSPLDGYAILLDLLKKDVTNEFLNRFQKLFKTFVSAEKPLLYVTEEEEDEE